MLHIDKEGIIIDDNIEKAISPMIENGVMKTVCGIIVHQTGAATAKSTFESYKIAHADGAHFLIDKDGTIYQTASVYRQTTHVGKLRSRCMLELRCSPAEAKLNAKFNALKEHNREKVKSVPDTFPSNQDSIGIELVAAAVKSDSKKSIDSIYETVTPEQNNSLQWLISQLKITLNIPATEIFRHPTVSYKNKSEASTAKWEK